MNRLTFYMVKQVAGVTIFVTVLLCLAIWLTQSLRLVDLIVNRGLPLSTFAYMATLLLPRFLVIVLPIAVFCAALFTFNRLISDSELVIMNSAGLSPFSLAKPAIYVASVVSLIVVSLNMYLLPISYRAFKDLQFSIRHDYSSVLLQEGVFNTLTDGITVFVRERGPKGELNGILVHDNRNLSQPVTMMAEQGALVRTDEGPRVILFNGNRQQVDRQGGQLSLLYFEKYTVDIGKAKAAGNKRWHEPRERFLADLLTPGRSPGDQQNRGKLIAEGHSRISATLLPLTYTIVGLAFLLGGSFNRRGQPVLMLCAIGTATLILILHLSAINLSAKIPTMIFGIYAVALVPLALGLFFLYSPIRRRIPPKTASVV